MAPCCQNYVTPTMIKKGQMEIGDRIQFEEDVLVSGPAASEAPSAAEEPAAGVHVAMPYPATAAEQQYHAAESNKAGNSTPGSWDSGNIEAVPGPGSGTVTQNSQNITNQNPPQNRRPDYMASSWGQTNMSRPVDLSALPLIFEEMTNYAASLSNTGGNTPEFSIPAHPMVPSAYDQTIDYDSMQYMNGFLRTQIGRGVMVQQLIGSGNTVDRYGFLVGVGNNYLLLQDISNGNIMLVDFYTIKYVYIYYSQPVFPSFRPAEQNQRIMR